VTPPRATRAQRAEPAANEAVAQQARSPRASPCGRAIALGRDSRCPVLVAAGIEKSYWRGLWPHRRRLVVLRGADLQLCAGEVVGRVPPTWGNVGSTRTFG
jgi:hypothetical protein